MYINYINTDKEMFNEDDSISSIQVNLYDSEKKVLDYIKEQGLSPIRIQKLPEAKHIFSHVEWHMSGYVVSVEENAFATEEQKKLSKEAKLLFVDTEETREKYAIPTAFAAYVRLFLDNLR